MLFVNDVPEKFKHAVHLYDKLFFTLYKLNKLIKVRKDPRLKTRSNVVYKLDCKDCDALYVRQTSRHLKTKILEYCINNIIRRCNL